MVFFYQRFINLNYRVENSHSEESAYRFECASHTMEVEDYNDMKIDDYNDEESEAI